MRKSYVLAFFLLVAAGGLIRLCLAYFLVTAPMPPLQRIQDFSARHGDQRAIVLVGDSLVEWAQFSPTICGLPVVNAGAAGARAKDVLSLIEGMKRMRFAPAILVISVGVNDAIVADDQPFAQTYGQIIAEAAALAGKVYLVSLAPVASSGSMASLIDRTKLSDVTQAVRQAAQQHSLPLIDVGTLNTPASPVTADGVHLSRQGYLAWTGLIEDALGASCP